MHPTRLFGEAKSSRPHVSRGVSLRKKKCCVDAWLLSPPYLLSSPFFSLLPTVVATQIGCHVAGSSPLSALRFVPIAISLREGFSSFFPRRLASLLLHSVPTRYDTYSPRRMTGDGWQMKSYSSSVNSALKSRTTPKNIPGIYSSVSDKI